MQHLKLFLGVLAFFHLSEFLLACLFMRHELGFSSLLFSKPYCIAMSVAVVEYLLEYWLFPSLKKLIVVTFLGVALAILGEAIRKCAMLTARASFTHQIRFEKEDSHQLVTHGIYRFIRHPGYLGWFLWAVSTQLLLVNPVCTVVFTIVSWKFFSERIRYEESTLLRFFGDNYADYRRSTPTWIPFIP